MFLQIKFIIMKKEYTLKNFHEFESDIKNQDLDKLLITYQKDGLNYIMRHLFNDDYGFISLSTITNDENYFQFSSFMKSFESAILSGHTISVYSFSHEPEITASEKELSHKNSYIEKFVRSNKEDILANKIHLYIKHNNLVYRLKPKYRTIWNSTLEHVNVEYEFENIFDHTNFLNQHSYLSPTCLLQDLVSDGYEFHTIHNSKELIQFLQNSEVKSETNKSNTEKFQKLLEIAKQIEDVFGHFSKLLNQTINQ